MPLPTITKPIITKWYPPQVRAKPALCATKGGLCIGRPLPPPRACRS